MGFLRSADLCMASIQGCLHPGMDVLLSIQVWEEVLHSMNSVNAL